MGEDAAQRRAERAERAEYHLRAQRRRSEQESVKAQVLVDRFVSQATEKGLAAEGRTPGEASLREMEELWVRAKRAEREPGPPPFKRG